MRPVLALAVLALFLPMAAQAAGLTVPVDQSRRLPINGAAANVVVGNTEIADVRAIDSRTLMVVGKRQGVTNVVVLDVNGRTLFDGQITVAADSGSRVTVYRGATPAEYACSPYCQSSAATPGAVQDGAPPIQMQMQIPQSMIAPSGPRAPAAAAPAPTGQ